MKMFKKALTAALVALTVTGTAFASSSALYNSTASTIEDDEYNFMNLLDWNKLSFDKVFGFMDVGTGSMCNLALGTKVNKKDVLAASWLGNTWSDNHQNYFDVFYGTGNMAFDLGFDEYKGTLGSSGTISIYNPSISFGMNINKKLGIIAFFNIPFGSEEVASSTTNYVIPTFGAEGTYLVLDNGTMTGKLDFGYTAVISTASNSDAESSYCQGIHTLFAQFRYNFMPVKNFTYGLKAYVPLTFGAKPQVKYAGKSDTLDMTTFSFAPTISNGFEIAVKPGFLVGAGVKTTLPVVTSTTVDDDTDSSLSDLVNSYYAGIAWTLAKEFELDAYATLDSDMEFSLDDIWNTDFHFSVTVNL